MDARELGEDYFEVLYVEQSRGFELREVKGWFTNGTLFSKKKAADREFAKIEAVKREEAKAD